MFTRSTDENRALAASGSNRHGVVAEKWHYRTMTRQSERGLFSDIAVSRPLRQHGSIHLRMEDELAEKPGTGVNGLLRIFPKFAFAQ